MRGDGERRGGSGAGRRGAHGAGSGNRGGGRYGRNPARDRDAYGDDVGDDDGVERAPRRGPSRGPGRGPDRTKLFLALGGGGLLLVILVVVLATSGGGGGRKPSGKPLATVPKAAPQRPAPPLPAGGREGQKSPASREPASRKPASIKVSRQVVGLGETNCYVLQCQGEPSACAVIDPGSQGSTLIGHLASEGSLTPSLILLTHAHPDHIGAVGDLKEKFPQAVYAAPAGETATLYYPRPERLLRDGDELSVGEIRLRVIGVPGHSKDGMAFYVPAQLGSGPILFSGDILFAGSVGRSDLEGGNEKGLLSGIKKKLLVLPPETVVKPGHGDETTIGEEKKNNPFLR